MKNLLQNASFSFFVAALLLNISPVFAAPVKANTVAGASWTMWDAQHAAPSIVVAPTADEIERDAASQLQKYLARIMETTPNIIEENGATTNANTTFFVGRVERVPTLKVLLPGLTDEGYVIDVRPQEKRVFLCGTSDMSTQYAVADFLQKFCGVRWYLPDGLFEVVPHRSAITIPIGQHVENPTFSPRTFGYAWVGAGLGYVGEKVPGFDVDRWAIRQRLSVDGRGRPVWTANHALMGIVPPAIYGATHPEYFPLIDGKRQVPPAGSDVGWQPELTNPEVVQLAIEAGRKFFAANPESWKWFSLSVTDGGGWSQSAETRAAIGAPYDFRGSAMVSDMYYAFVDKVARVLEDEFPGRHIGVLAYLDVEAPPRNLAHLPKNVNILMTQDSSQYFDAQYRAGDDALVKRWQKIANGNVYRYDYHGLGWLVPRFYPQLIAADARRNEALGLKGFYTEDVPIWPLSGPMLYILARSWWNPDESANTTLDEFCTSMFGQAAPPMRKYFQELEVVWKKPRPGRFFEGLGDPQTQTALYSAADRENLDTLMERAGKLAQHEDPTVKKRVAFFADGWKLATFYLRENELGKSLQSPMQDAAQAETCIKMALQLLQLVDAHDKFYDGLLQSGDLISGDYKNFGNDTGWRDSMRSLAASTLLDTLEVVSHTDAGRAKVLAISLRDTKNISAETQKTLMGIVDWFSAPVPENKLANAALQADENTGAWQNGPPPLWNAWSAATVQMQHRNGAMRFEDAAGTIAMQDISVTAGKLFRFSVRYRTNEKYQGKVILRVRWRDAKGAWYPNGGEAFDLIAAAPSSAQERSTQIIGHVPEGATTTVLMIGAGSQMAGDWVEFTQPYFGIKP